jgi:hypothetical protein
MIGFAVGRKSARSTKAQPVERKSDHQVSVRRDFKFQQTHKMHCRFIFIYLFPSYTLIHNLCQIAVSWAVSPGADAPLLFQDAEFQMCLSAMLHAVFFKAESLEVFCVYNIQLRIIMKEMLL